MNKIKGKVAWVTGGTRGIGRAIALALGDAGADVALTYQKSATEAEEVTGCLREKGVRGLALRASASSMEETQAAFERIRQELGEISILVINAGITRDKSFVKMTRSMWDDVMRVNLDALFVAAQAVVPGMVEAGWGRIITISSIVGQTGNFGQTNYAASKAGAIGFTMSLARELGRKGVTVNAVAPGFIETDMTKLMPQSALEQVKALTPIGRLGRPEEVADAVVFLAASKAAAYITGQVLAVNGGMYM
jgi:3-oxoacyl-(acyl-carrier-protein) reductase